ncbi:hypothetical protein XENOCAPTIV_020407 [Xenoophorus captivus]|uniref:Uncharacterized protein n=1 Tax=Xenoophorus captivus TaxID=1517983 RepID=A0ABV0RL99_9TELE
MMFFYCKKNEYKRNLIQTNYFSQEYKDTMSSTCSGDTEPERINRPLINVAKHLGNLQYAVWEKMKQIAPYTPVILDPRTAGLSVKVSSELNSFHIAPGPSQRAEQHVNEAAPANAERFHPHPCILAREGFNTGVHCWNIEVFTYCNVCTWWGRTACRAAQVISSVGSKQMVSFLVEPTSLQPVTVRITLLYRFVCVRKGSDCVFVKSV